MRLLLENKLLKYAFVLAILISAGCSEANSTAQFRSLRSMVIAGKFNEAIPKLEKFAAENPKSVDASRAGLFLFKANFGNGDLAEARKWCDWTIKNYPSSLEAQKCKYKLAVVTMAEGDIEQATEQFAALASNPSGPYTAEATAMKRFLDQHSVTPR